MISVVIPAHNEESVIGRCLQALTSGEGAEQLQIVVVCNGCIDKTAEIASQFSSVKVIDIAVASKIAALNEGDRHINCYPIAYVDADVHVTAKDLVCAASALGNSVLCTAPRMQVDLDQSGALVKAFYRVWTRLPYFSTKNMVGSGIFILSELGRKRFSDFPDVVADDGYVRGLYNNDERKTVDGCTFTIFAPKDISSLVKIKTRVRYGNMQVAQQFPQVQVGGENTFKAFLMLMVSKPWLVPSGIVYIGVQFLTKRRSVARLRSNKEMVWDRDQSSRLSR